MRSCIAVGSRREFRIYSCFPFAKRFAKATAGIRIVEMLNCTSLVALVGSGSHVRLRSPAHKRFPVPPHGRLQPQFSPRLLKLWNMKSQRGILDLPFESTILAVRLNRQRCVSCSALVPAAAALHGRAWPHASVRIVVVCETKIHIFRLTNATFLQTVDTVPNPNGAPHCWR